MTDNTDTSSYCEETYNYIGCTRSSIHSRMLGHKRGQKSKLKSNPLYRHDCDYHSGDPQQYTTTILSSERKIVILNCNKALNIEKQDPM